MQERLRNQEVASRLAGDSLDPLGHVHGVADHRELELAIPSEDADEHLAVVPADADPHRRLAGPLAMLAPARDGIEDRSEEHTSELQSLMRNSYAVLCLK